MKKKKDNVVILNCMTRLNLPPDRVLEAAKGELQDAVVLGWYKDTEKLYFASTTSDCKEIIWLLTCAKEHAMKED